MRKRGVHGNLLRWGRLGCAVEAHDCCFRNFQKFPLVNFAPFAHHNPALE